MSIFKYGILKYFFEEINARNIDLMINNQKTVNVAQ